MKPQDIQLGIIIVFATIIFLVLLTGILEYYQYINFLEGGLPPYNIDFVVTLLNVIFSVILTLALVALYATQAGIQEDQKEILEYNQKPDLIVNEINAAKVEGRTHFVLDIANIGKAAAKDIKTIIEPTIESERVKFQPSIHHVARNFEDLHAHTERDNFLLPGNSEEFFDMCSFNSNIGGEGGGDGFAPCTFEFVTDKLSKDGCEKITFRLAIQFRGPDDNDYTTEISEFILPIKGRTSLVVAFDNGITRHRMENDPHFSGIQSRVADLDPDTGYFDQPD